MYVERYDDDGIDAVQAVGRFPTVVREAPAVTNGWWAQAGRVTALLLAAPRLDFALRVTVEAGRLDRLLMILAPADLAQDTDVLRTNLGFLNMIVEDSAAFPLDRPEHAAMVAAFPPERWCLRQDVELHRQCALLHDVRLFKRLGDLLHTALAYGATFGYQLNVRHAPLGPEDQRWLRKNLVGVADDRSLPRPVVAFQTGVAERLGRAGFLVDEFVGFASDVDRSRLFEAVDTAFAGSLAEAGLPAPRFDAAPAGEFDGAIVTGVHSSVLEERSPAERLIAAATADDLAALLGWRPPDTWTPLIRNASPPIERELDHLKRIEVRLARIERALGARRAASPECAELKAAVDISRTHPPMALGKARVIVEGIVGAIYRERHPQRRSTPPLFNMIDELTEIPGIFPRTIASYLHTLRVLGNRSLHAGEVDTRPLSDVDVELALLMVLDVVGWYVLERGAAPPRESPGA